MHGKKRFIFSACFRLLPILFVACNYDKSAVPSKVGLDTNYLCVIRDTVIDSVKIIDGPWQHTLNMYAGEDSFGFRGVSGLPLVIVKEMRGGKIAITIDSMIRSFRFENGRFREAAAWKSPDWMITPDPNDADLNFDGHPDMYFTQELFSNGNAPTCAFIYSKKIQGLVHNASFNLSNMRVDTVGGFIREVFLGNGWSGHAQKNLYKPTRDSLILEESVEIWERGSNAARLTRIIRTGDAYDTLVYRGRKAVSVFSAHPFDNYIDLLR